MSRADVTQALAELRMGGASNSPAVRRLFELVYEELRHVASDMMRAERNDHTLQPTALVHEAYCRLVDGNETSWQNRAHFFGIAARAMREILVEHARARAAAKRGGGWQRLALSDELHVAPQSEIELPDLNDALTHLAELDERMVRIVELRVFVGMTAEEAAHVLGLSRRTVQNEWRVAMMWLRRELAGADHGP